MALIPAPPIPTMWMRWGVRRSSWGSAGRGGGGGGVRGVSGHGHRPARPPWQRRRVAQASGGSAHGRETVGIGEQRRHLGLQPLRIAFGVGHDRRAGGNQCLGIAGLMVPWRTRQRHQDGRDAAHQELGHRHGPGTAHEKVGGTIENGHPILIRHHLDTQSPGPGRVSPPAPDEPFIVTPTGHLVQREIPAVEPARGQVGHGGVDAVGAQRAAEGGQRPALLG